VRLDRAATKLLALASTMGVLGALTVAAAGPAAADTAGGPREQAIVALSGDWAVTVPGLHVQALLGAVQIEIVDGTSAQLTQLATTPGVLSVEPNLKAHLLSDSFGQPASPTTIPAPSTIQAPTSSPAPTPSSWDPSGAAAATAAPAQVGHGPGSSSDGAVSANGVLAPSTLGGKAGKPDAGRDVTVAVIDTGVTDTAALNRASGRLVDAVDTSGLNTTTGHIDEDGVFTDGYGHGTFMASLIAGGKVDGSGKLGVGVVPGATIDVVKVADANGDTSLGAVLAGLDWVSTHSDQVDVANLSLSVDRPSDRYGIDPLNYAVQLTRNSGVTVVVAAGNTPGVVGDPGFGPASLTVGAADTTANRAKLASFSGYANVAGLTKPDVVAAGVNLLGEMPADSIIGQQFPNARQDSGLFRGSGTSQSAAIVSGLAALYLQSHHSASTDEVKAAIRDSASSITSGKQDGEGLVSIPDGGRSHGALNTGERDLNYGQWMSTAPQWADLFGSGVFDARRWGARRWNADGWDARRWGAAGWDARRWGSGGWDARRWGADGWDARRWGANAWDARRWGGQMWAASSWGDGS
jgi:serine protease AprX